MQSQHLIMDIRELLTDTSSGLSNDQPLWSANILAGKSLYVQACQDIQHLLILPGGSNKVETVDRHWQKAIIA